MKMTRLLAVILCISALQSYADEVRISQNGLVLNADLELAEGSDLADGVILMLHGTLGHKDMEVMATLQTVFQEYGRNTLAINLSLDIDDRHGFYPCERPHTHDYTDALTELGVWFAWLKENGAGDIVVFGHSRGANQIANYIRRDAIAVQAAILLAPSVNAGSPQHLQQNLRDARNSEWLASADFLHCKNARVLGSSFLSYYGVPGQSDTPALLREIKVPALVLSGSEDTVVVGLGDKLQDINDGNVSHVEVDGADHFFRDLYAYDVVDASIEFIETLGESSPLIEFATVLQADATSSAEKNQPIAIFVTRQGCQFCQLLREQVLHPLIGAGELSQCVILREVSLDDGFVMQDFRGRETSGRDFADRYNAAMTPTILFLDGEGREVTDRIVGISNLEYYGFYFDKAIQAATAELLKAREPARTQ